MSISTIQHGQKFGLLTVLGEGGHKNKLKVWRLRCDCGQETRVITCHLTSGHTKSCGCLKDRKGAELGRYKGVGSLSGKFYSDIRSRARRRQFSFDVSIQQIYDLFNKQKGFCALSGEPISFKDHTASLDRIDSTRGYSIENVQWVHKTVNQMKWDSAEKDFLFWVEKINSNQKKLCNKEHDVVE